MAKVKTWTPHGMSYVPEYKVWTALKGRCENPNGKRYKHYGGRGIKCLYDGFMDFYNDVGQRPTNRHSIDRINNNGNYEQGNCRWATYIEQNRNNSRNVFITIKGETKTLIEWSNIVGIDPHAFKDRLRNWAEQDWLIPDKRNNFGNNIYGYIVYFDKNKQKYRARIRIRKTRKEISNRYFINYDDAIKFCENFING